MVFFAKNKVVRQILLEGLAGSLEAIIKKQPNCENNSDSVEQQWFSYKKQKNSIKKQKPGKRKASRKIGEIRSTINGFGIKTM